MQLLLLTELDQTLNKSASIQPADGLSNCIGPIADSICTTPLLKTGMTGEVLNWGNRQLVHAALNKGCSKGTNNVWGPKS